MCARTAICDQQYIGENMNKWNTSIVLNATSEFKHNIIMWGKAMEMHYEIC